MYLDAGRRGAGPSLTFVAATAPRLNERQDLLRPAMVCSLHALLSRHPKLLLRPAIGVDHVAGPVLRRPDQDPFFRIGQLRDVIA